eukprot:TRINITY_DN6586_c0_g2_i1.p1 TRINITY_DN6586_c0_g2~~TRINITY_DN6586_c0_g2_i1.p1  ORF type:complete len:445 (+),score=67.01 TRINITY_DN6586_c0_g2_i1:101-1435(+)
MAEALPDAPKPVSDPSAGSNNGKVWDQLHGVWLDDDMEELHCICREPNDGRVMVCCDKCDVWYHGECVGMTQADIDALDDDNLEYTCLVCKGMTHDEIRALAAQKREQQSTALSAADGYDALASLLVSEAAANKPRRRPSNLRHGSDDEDDADYVPEALFKSRQPSSKPHRAKPISKRAKPSKPAAARSKRKPPKRQPYSRERSRQSSISNSSNASTASTATDTAVSQRGPKLSGACVRRLQRLGQKDDPLLKLYKDKLPTQQAHAPRPSLPNQSRPPHHAQHPPASRPRHAPSGPKPTTAAAPPQKRPPPPAPPRHSTSDAYPPPPCAPPRAVDRLKPSLDTLRNPPGNTSSSAGSTASMSGGMPSPEDISPETPRQQSRVSVSGVDPRERRRLEALADKKKQSFSYIQKLKGQQRPPAPPPKRPAVRGRIPPPPPPPRRQKR